MRRRLLASYIRVILGRASPDAPRRRGHDSLEFHALRRHVTAYRLTVAALMVLLALIVGLNGLGSFYTDIKPEVYLAPWRMVGAYLSAWSGSPYLGAGNFNVGLVPVLLVTSALRGIGLSPEWAFKVLHFALWLLAAWGAARLLRRLSPGAGRWAGLAAGVVFVANPYAVQAGTTLAIALPYALLPWMLLAFVRALRGAPGWRWSAWIWPAIFGLLFFAMSGMNVAVVPVFQLIALIPVMIFARSDWGLSWRHIGAVLAKCAIFVVGVSAYWLVPSIAAIGHGVQIADSSETITGIAKVSSFPEVLRGLGLWPLYGMGDQGAWVPQDAVYLTSPLMMMLTILWPALGMLALRWCRGLLGGVAAVLIGLAAVIMVGAFPSEDHPASPFGHVVVWFLHLPGMAAFRTTNKIGALLALGLALAIGVALLRVGPRLWSVPGAAPVAGACAFVLLFAWTLPALTGRLYTSQMNVPAYWHKAASWLDDQGSASSVLFAPGQTRSSYRWTAQRPDDVANSLMSRRAIIPETTPNASAPGANFLMAMDRTLQDGVVPSGTISAYARYLGAGQILVRHDTRWRADGGARPLRVDRVMEQDRGLHRAKSFGPPGEFVVGSVQDEESQQEAKLPPLQVYDVAHPRATVRAEGLGDSLLVAGDGWSLPSLQRAGLLSSMPSFQYAQDVPASALSNHLGGGHRLVITDTNARRAAIPGRLTDGEGALLTSGESTGLTRTLGDDPQDQTVLARSGATVSATSQGATFFKIPYGVAANALDDDPSTAWLFGDFHRAPGQVLTITEPSPIELHTMKIAQAQVGSAKIDKVTVRAGDKAVTRRLPSTGYATFDLGGVKTSKVTVTIDSERGQGYNLVGIRDISMPGPRAERAARTPTTFSERYRQLDARQRATFDETPLDVLLRRVQGTPSVRDDTQTGLRRIVTLPDSRTFRASAKVRVSDAASERTYDRIAGFPDDLVASSSDFYFHQRRSRASLAADGRDATGWVPGGRMKDSWWQLKSPRRTISQVTITQRPGPGDRSGRDTLWASRVTISVDGRSVKTAALKPDGTTTIHIPKTTGRTVRVTIDRTDGPLKGTPARFTRIDTGKTIRPTAHQAPDAKCVTVATVDGNPLKMKPDTDHIAGGDEQGTRWVGCGTTTLGPGSHTIEQAPGFTLDTLDLLDVQTASQHAVAAPTTHVTDKSRSHLSMRVTSHGPAAIVIGQSYNAKWHATANGHDLGKPQVIDGYSTGWVLPKAGHYTVDVTYGPQTRADVALWASAAVFLVALLLIVLGAVRRTIGVVTEVPDERRQPVRALVPGLPRPLCELALAALSTLAAGWAGLIAALAVVVLLRIRRVRPVWLLAAGVALIVGSLALYIALLGDARGQISADAVASSMWPHHLAGAGLVVGLVGAMLARRRRHDGPGDDHD